ncbi:MAG: phthalate 4,5-dioxygenase [Chloroflexota bacterium]|jgi:phthalate 4,5-dioxygenase oxygenase subunit|nr:phthalate 4,5-dioxygenase [Chloroflexota bacterium]
MLTQEETELLTRVGRGTPMGELMRRYWMPICLTEEIPEPDCDPYRVRILGEDLVAFRDSQGRVGVMEERCPHRRASLAIGRNEEGGLRCLYHGWKIDVEGNVLDTPCEPDGSTFKDRVKHRAYPVREHAELVWAYMGPAALVPPFPTFEWSLLPPSHRSWAKSRAECNWLQGLEGNVDYAHATVLHSGWAIMGTWEHDDWHRPTKDTNPRHEVEDTAYGFRYAAISRHVDEPDRLKWVQAMSFAMPFHGLLGGQAHMFVPIDDEHYWNFNVFYNREQPVNHERHLAARHHVIGVDLNPDRTRIQTVANNFLQDREAMRARRSFSGIAGNGPNQDMAVLETMGPISDRTEEHLGASDLAVIHVRQLLLDAVRTFQAGGEPRGLDPSIRWDQIYGGTAVIPIDAPWQRVGEAVAGAATYSPWQR